MKAWTGVPWKINNLNIRFLKGGHRRPETAVLHKAPASIIFPGLNYFEKRRPDILYSLASLMGSSDYLSKCETQPMESDFLPFLRIFIASFYFRSLFCPFSCFGSPFPGSEFELFSIHCSFLNSFSLRESSNSLSQYQTWYNYLQQSFSLEGLIKGQMKEIRFKSLPIGVPLLLKSASSQPSKTFYRQSKQV